MNRQYLYNHSIKGIYRNYKCRAKKKGLMFTLSIDELEKLIKSKCHYCGDNGGEIDRIDNGMGYIRDNCYPSCELCNRMKLTCDYDIFIEQCEKITQNNAGRSR